MNIESIVGTYGYPAIIAGTFFEGETVLVIGGFLAHRGYLSLPAVILCALIGSLTGDQLYFFIGRIKGQEFIDRRPWLKNKVERFRHLLDRYNTVVVPGFRFLYGIRTVAPFVIGMSRISSLKFFFLNILSAVVWSAVVGTAGYFFGRGIEALLGDLEKYEILILSAVALMAVIKLLYGYMKKRISPN